MLIDFTFFLSEEGTLCYSCTGNRAQRQCLDEPWNVTTGNPKNCSGACMTDRVDNLGKYIEHVKLLKLTL